MRFSTTALWLAVLSSVCAYAITGGSVALNDKKLFSVDPASTDVRRVAIDSEKDVLSFAVNLDAVSKPHQLVLTLSDGAGLVHPVFASYDGSKATARVAVHRLPASLKMVERIFVSLVAASAGEPNLNEPLVELVPTDEFRLSVEYKKPVRLGALPEIHHIFREDPATVNAFFPVVFSAAAGALLVALFGAWASVLGGSAFGAKQAAVWKSGFLATITLVEVTFVKYYLGATIFTTLFHVFLLGGPCFFFFSRALSAMARVRSA